ncbi:precorrin-6y C5,15-methyltransferase (decarboxylating), CbiE subunit [Desulfovibrio sp. X2]|uniref:bifunctional cobalt-precorrin-7 (C(5))-methyltransferase/cobalt-precorrin-6B (C(15))-methyltransferase n=1 Tax=Desulfovibrio sp. X2 TaxID=941449 RepID=UPI000358869F|nr:bifunctional cobalt-precorrin-7 (C(5))-methyltransferase/cobalt-precorrin-6B (C(15))-methyltransferase [Desulfovibrio sp. X2]EPR42116.1 precorrin-6y C5,15-methyltransferase (decarboxylating), CbiE subunit [Desulfovibrio sp. X2]
MIEVVGIGLNPELLCGATCLAIADADVIVGGKRQLAAFPDAGGERIAITAPLGKVIDAIRARSDEGRRVVVLADGDPLFYGIGRTLIETLGAESVRIHPGVTTLQTAAARMGLPWQDIRVVSMHGRDDQAPLFAALTWYERVAVFTDDEHTPGTIARSLLERGATDYGMWVFEDLESPTERIGLYSLEHAVQERFSPLNMAVLERRRKAPLPLRLGIPDEDLAHEGDMITKWPVRAVGLASLAIEPEDVVWDVGAGCGAVSIEAAVLASDGEVVAVERDERRMEMLRENLRRTGAWSVLAVAGEAPDCLAGLPDPDRIFVGGGLGGGIGGGGSQGEEVLRACCRRLKPGGRITAHAVLLDSLSRAQSVFASLSWPTSIQQVQVSQSEILGPGTRLRGQNPVFVISATRPA